MCVYIYIYTRTTESLLLSVFLYFHITNFKPREVWSACHVCAAKVLSEAQECQSVWCSHKVPHSQNPRAGEGYTIMNANFKTINPLESVPRHTWLQQAQLGAHVCEMYSLLNVQTMLMVGCSDEWNGVNRIGCILSRFRGWCGALRSECADQALSILRVGNQEEESITPYDHCVTFNMQRLFKPVQASRITTDAFLHSEMVTGLAAAKFSRSWPLSCLVPSYQEKCLFFMQGTRKWLPWRFPMGKLFGRPYFVTHSVFGLVHLPPPRQALYPDTNSRFEMDGEPVIWQRYVEMNSHPERQTRYWTIWILCFFAAQGADRSTVGYATRANRQAEALGVTLKCTAWCCMCVFGALLKSIAHIAPMHTANLLLLCCRLWTWSMKRLS